MDNERSRAAIQTYNETYRASVRPHGHCDIGISAAMKGIGQVSNSLYRAPVSRFC